MRRLQVNRSGKWLLAFALSVLIASAAAVSAVAQTPASPQSPPAASGNRIEVEAANLRNSNGSFRCTLYNGAEGFLKNDKAEVASIGVKIQNRQATCVFPNLSPGNYALVAIHDENDNRKMDYNFMGMPKEGYGFSDDPTVILSAPSFEAAKFQYTSGVLKLPLRLHY